MTYYGYVQRENAAGVNWQEVGANLSQTLLDAGAARQAKRDAFDKSTKEYQETLDNAPSGDFKTANAFALNHAADASRMRLIQDRLLKSGVMKDRDYTVARQNLTDGTKQLFGLSKEYQEEYTEKMKRFKDGESQQLEGWLMEQIEGLSNLKNSQSYINSQDGSVSIGKLVDGPGGTRVMSKNPNDFMTVNQLRNRYKEKYDKFDVGETMTMEAERLGTFITSVRDAGGSNYAGTVTKLLDPTVRGSLGPKGVKAVDDFKSMETDMINSYLESNPLNALSVLTDGMVNPANGKPFEPTFDEAEAKKDPNKVLIKDDGSGRIEPVLSKEQKKLAFDSVQTNFRNKIDREETISTYNEPKKQQPNAAAIKAANDNANKKAAISSWNDLFYAKDPAGKKAALENLLGSQISKNNNLRDIDLTVPGEVEFIYKDSSKNRVIEYDPDNISIDDWARLGNEIHGVDDVTKVLDRSGGRKTDAEGNPLPGVFGEDALTDVFAARQGDATQQSIQEAYSDYLDREIDGSRFSYADSSGDPIDDANGEMIKAFKSKMPKDFTLSENIGVGDDTDRFVEIKKKGGGTLDIDITKSDYADKIKDFILNNSTSKEDIERMSLTKGVKRRDVSTTTKSRRNRRSNTTKQNNTVNNSGGVGAGYN